MALRRGASHTFTAMERHMDCRKVVGQGFPMRAVRTQDYLYIRNFEPSRAPAGDASVKTWTAEQIATLVYTDYGDIDAAPTKAYLATGKDDPAVKPYFDRAIGPRPARELYAVEPDPTGSRIWPSALTWPRRSHASTAG